MQAPKVDERKLRKLPGWDKAPVPICMGGDYRALTFCCKPGYALTFAGKCGRDAALAEIGLTPAEFVAIKEEFSQEKDWGDEFACFGSLSYCCMRGGGCPRRDSVLARKYPTHVEQNAGRSVGEKVMQIYFENKKELAKLILSRAKKREIVELWLDFDA